jgi:hypothetical protein
VIEYERDNGQLTRNPDVELRDSPNETHLGQSIVREMGVGLAGELVGNGGQVGLDAESVERDALSEEGLEAFERALGFGGERGGARDVIFVTKTWVDQRRGGNTERERHRVRNGGDGSVQSLMKRPISLEVSPRAVRAWSAAMRAVLMKEVSGKSWVELEKPSFR